MLRWLYIQFIWLHPPPFRWRFGDDMLDDFDRAPRRAKLRYLADAIPSLIRQWLLRPEFRHPEAPDAVLASPGAPSFQTIEPYKLPPAVWFQGGLLAIFWILAATVLITKGGGGARPFLIGAHFSRPGLLQVDRNSIAATGLNTTVEPAPDPFDAWLKLARPYFTSMPVLRALDADGNLTLSPWEIGKSPAALRRLDINHTGKVTAAECGLHIDPNSVPPARLAQLRLRFMGYHPVLAALDADHDGEISVWEIDRAVSALKTLDQNHDGYLTPDELVPFEMAVRRGLR